MHKGNSRRVQAHYLTELGAEVYLEEGYGSRSGFIFEDYQFAMYKFV